MPMMGGAILIQIVILLANAGVVYCEGACSWSSSCDWASWGAWSSIGNWEGGCLHTCGTTEQTLRLRALCYPESWDSEKRYQRCNTTWRDGLEWKLCGRVCYNGGTFHGLSKQHCECPQRFHGRCCEQRRLQTCEPYPTDLMFLLDSSVSQTEPEFQRQLEFISRFIDEIEIGEEAFNVAVITFSREAVVEIYPNNNVTTQQLKDQISNIQFRPGPTFTHKALQAAIDLASSKSQRRPGMSTLSQTMLLTDGMSANRQLTKDKAKELQGHSHVIAIGIGKEVSQVELQAIASPGDSYTPSYVFSVDNFNSLNTLLQRLVETSCPNCTRSQLSDIFFFIDGRADGMTEDEFQSAINMVSDIVDSLSALGNDAGQRVGVYFLSDDEQFLPLSNNLGKLELLSYINRLRRDDTCSGSRCSSVEFGDKLKYVMENYYNTSLGGRTDARKFLLVASSGRFQSTDNINTDILTTISTKNNITRLAISSGYDVNMDVLISLVDNPSYVYLTQDNEMEQLDILQAKFSYVTCV